MNNIEQAIWVETLKARRSRMPLLTALGFLLIPLGLGFFMIVLKDPELALRVGLISTKAHMLAGAADWPTYLGLLAQSGVGGILLFPLIGGWVFGREFSDRTAKDLLALPTSRSAIVLAKFIVFALWSTGLFAVVYLAGLAVGTAVGFPPAPAQVFLQAGTTLAVTAMLTLAVAPPVVFFASAGHGYLPPIGVAILTMIFAQLIQAAGWGEYFPWSIPGVYAQGGELGMVSYVIAALTCLAGLAATFIWWELADQTH
jgi:ABC-2 type transport system permease protein